MYSSTCHIKGPKVNPKEFKDRGLLEDYSEVLGILIHSSPPIHPPT